ncbi:MAG: XRE family transcriptional regulator [Mycobacterium sp.]
MPRTDENGRQLKALLDYLLDGDVEAKNIFDALGVSSSTYYRRLKEHDYPNAEELRLVSDRFGLNYPDLQVRFGLMSRQEVWQYIESAPLTVATAPEKVEVKTVPAARADTRHHLPKLSEFSPRQDAPPL